MIKNFNDVFETLKAKGICKRMVVAWGVDEHSIEAAYKAAEKAKKKAEAEKKKAEAAKKKAEAAKKTVAPVRFGAEQALATAAILNPSTGSKKSKPAKKR